MLQQIILFLTGLAFLIFSLLKLSAGMQRLLGVRIRHYIKELVKKPIRSAWLGAAMTVLFQSSSATMILAVGLVSAGLISFFNSLGIILGAGVGTTITLQLVAFKFADISPVFIIAGILLWLVGKEKQKAIGEAVFYFGLLFFSLLLMGQALEPLKQEKYFINLLQYVQNPLFAILISFVFTALVQASSITASLAILLAQQGLISSESGICFVLGASIGTTATAILASIGSGKSTKQTAFSYFIFRFLTVAVIFLFLPYFVSFLKYLAPKSVGQQIVNAYLFEAILSMILFFPILRGFSKLVEKIIPSEEKVFPLWSEYLDEKFLAFPSEALVAVKKELHRGVLLLQEMLSRAGSLIDDFRSSGLRDINYLELVLDSLQKDVMRFLDKLPKKELEKEGVMELIRYSALVDDIERIGDRLVNLAKLAEYKTERRVEFSAEGKKEIEELKKTLKENIDDLVVLMGEGRVEKARDIIKRRWEVNEIAKAARKKHLRRFYQRECSVSDGPIFNDILINFERISDDCVNIVDYYYRLFIKENGGDFE